MKLIVSIFTIIIGLLLLSCSKSRYYSSENNMSDTLTVFPEKDLFPEGTAFDAVSNSVFIGSMYHRKILMIHSDGRYEDFISEGQQGLLCPLGMEVYPKTHTLWAINGWAKSAVVARLKPDVADWNSKISCYDIKNRSLLREYKFVSPRRVPTFLNDLTFSNDGIVYATESLENIIYTLNPDNGRFEEFLRPTADYSFLNGIIFSSDNSKLFVASSKGIVVIDTKTRSYKLLAGEIHKHPSDGLAFYQNSLISHQSSVIRRLYLNKQLDSIVRSEVIDNKNLKSSTTGEIGSEWYYYIANAQLRTGINYSTMEVKPLDSLQNVVIKRKHL